MRIANWNLDHASNGARRVTRQVDQLRTINPDIVVLTETCEQVDLSPLGHRVVYPRIRNEYGKFDVAIWSKFPVVRILPTTNEELTVCAQIESPLGDLLVYGTIIPYHGYKGPAKTSAAWVEHYKAIEDQARDWASIRAATGFKLPLFVAGDFNQTRDNSVGIYGTNEGRQQLGDALLNNELVCLTTENFGENGKLKVDPKKERARNNIDHICVTRSRFNIDYVGAWDHFTDAGIYLSDHNGVYVDLSLVAKSAA